MNYEEARQIGPNGPAPGKWNWTNRNDSVAPNPFTTAPCRWPDFEWPAWDHAKGLDQQSGIKPTGRERCDHDTREEAERHHYEYDLGRVRIDRLDLSTIRERRRCDVPDCQNWERYRAHWPGGYVVDSLCSGHAGVDRVTAPSGSELIHPFAAGMQEIHS